MEKSCSSDGIYLPLPKSLPLSFFFSPSSLRSFDCRPNTSTLSKTICLPHINGKLANKERERGKREAEVERVGERECQRERERGGLREMEMNNSLLGEYKYTHAPIYCTSDRQFNCTQFLSNQK